LTAKDKKNSECLGPLPAEERGEAHSALTQGPATHLEAQLGAKEDPVGEQAQELMRLRNELDQAHKRVGEAAQKIELLEREKAEIVAVLEEINRSVGWRLVKRYRNLKNRLLAPGTLRRRLYDRWLIHFKHPSIPSNLRAGDNVAAPRRGKSVPAPGDDFYKAKLLPLKLPIILEAGHSGSASIEISNLSHSTWEAATQEPDGRGSVRLSYHWYKDDRALIQWDGERTNLPHDLRPSDSVTVDMPILIPFEPGTYILEIALIHEGIRWFDQNGGTSARSTVEVEPSQDVKTGHASCSIIIPVLDRAKFTKACLGAIEKSVSGKEIPFEVIVVDNGSSDGTPDFLSSWSRSHDNARVVRFRENLGFARACNEGARLARGRYLVFLNNDTLPTPHWLESMSGLAVTDDQIGVVGCRLLFPNGRIQHIGIAFDEKKNPRHIYRGFSADIAPAKLCREYQAVTGACLLMKKELYWAVGGMDETFHNSYEDLDLCLKVRSRGYRVVVCPDSVVYHFEGMSDGRGDSDFRNMALFKARWETVIDCDNSRWNDLDKLRDRSNEFEAHQGYDSTQENQLEDLWERVYSCSFPS
jgi:GT2 family glycosyltransferase